MMISSHMNEGFDGILKPTQPKTRKVQADGASQGSYTSSTTSCQRIISFGGSENEINNINPKEELLHYYEGGTNNGLVKHTHHKVNQKVASTPRCSRDHLLAERRRRERMTEKLVALSALIPGPKKTDKASILCGATEYIKQLEERVKVLKEQTTKTTVESTVLLKKRQEANGDDVNSSSNESFGENSNLGLLEIKARISNKNVLIKVHSQRKEGLIQAALGEIGKLHLTILNCNTMSFGSFAVDITVDAQMDDDFSTTAKGLVKHLWLALQQFTSPKSSKTL